MSRQRYKRWGVLAVVLLLIIAGLVVWGLWRMHQAARFGQAYQVQTYGGTNYVVRLADVTVGKTETGYALIVGLRVDNPNPFPLVLERKWFILVDHDKDYYLPSTTGTQTESFTVPPEGALEKEMLSFAVPDDALAGFVALQIGQYHWLQLKEDKPFTGQLRSGEFVSYRRLQWE